MHVILVITAVRRPAKAEEIMRALASQKMNTITGSKKRSIQVKENDNIVKTAYLLSESKCINDMC